MEVLRYVRYLPGSDCCNWRRELIACFFEQEASTGKVKIDEEEPEAIEVILKYIYGGGRYIDDRATETC